VILAVLKVPTSSLSLKFLSLTHPATESKRIMTQQSRRKTGG